MGGRRRNEILVGLAVMMFLGVAVYLRLWSIDYSASSSDTDLLRYPFPPIPLIFSSSILAEMSQIFFFWGRRQFDLTSKEAMDESAEWRLRYDEEAERTSQCLNELKQVFHQIPISHHFLCCSIYFVIT